MLIKTSTLVIIIASLGLAVDDVIRGLSMSAINPPTKYTNPMSDQPNQPHSLAASELRMLLQSVRLSKPQIERKTVLSELRPCIKSKMLVPMPVSLVKSNAK